MFIFNKNKMDEEDQALLELHPCELAKQDIDTIRYVVIDLGYDLKRTCRGGYHDEINK